MDDFDERELPTKAETSTAREIHASHCGCGGFGVDDLRKAKEELKRD